MTDPNPKFFSKGDGTTLQGLHAFLHTLKANGVRRYEGKLDTDAVVVEFFPLPSVRVPGEPDEAPEDTLRKLLEDSSAAGACACGHDMTSHNASGECLQGCPVAECARKPPRTPDEP